MTRLILVATLVLGTSCGKEEEKKEVTAPTSSETSPKEVAKTPPKEEVTKTAAPASTTTEFVAEDKKFSVMSKQKPRISNPASPAGVGPITSYMFSAKGAPGAYMILVATVPLTDKSTDADRKKALIDGRDGVVKKYGAKISNDKEIKVGDHVGRDFSFSATHPQMGEMVGRSKIIVRGSEVFQVMRVGAPSGTALIAEADAFIDSFKFTN